jgi:hypothetical protein
MSCSISLCNDSSLFGVDKKLLAFLNENRKKNDEEIKGSYNKNQMYSYLHPKATMFFHILPIDSFPEVLNLKTLPARYEKLFVSTNTGVACIMPVNTTDYIIELKGKNFSKSFYQETNNFTINYKPWSEVEQYCQ